MTFHGPLSVRPVEVWGSNPMRKVPSGHLMFLSSQLSSRLPCPPLHVPPGQKGESPRVEPVSTVPVSTFASSFASVLIRIFWLTGGAPVEAALPAVGFSEVGVSPSPQAAKPAAVTANARMSRPVRRGCRGTLRDASSIKTSSSSPLSCANLSVNATAHLREPPAAIQATPQESIPRTAPQTAALRQKQKPWFREHS